LNGSLKNFYLKVALGFFLFVSSILGCSRKNDYSVHKARYCAELLVRIGIDDLPDLMYFSDEEPLPLTESMKKIQKKWVSVHQKELKTMSGSKALDSCIDMRM